MRDVTAVKVLFFATLKDRTGIRQLVLELKRETRVGELKSLLEERYPALSSSLKSTLVAVNHEYAFDDDLIPPDAEIALFPPVSGG